MNLEFRRKTKLVTWTILGATLGVFLASVAFDSIAFNLKSAYTDIQNTAAVATDQSERETLQYFYLNKASKESNKDLKVSAQSYLVGDLATGEVIFSKKEEERLPIASVSKLMTALVTKQIVSGDDLVEISKQALNTEGKNGNLKVGEKIKPSELLYPLLLESSNDAAEALALYFGREVFINKMNETARYLEMRGTTYEDPSGLSPKNQSTVHDIFKLVGYIAKQNPDLLQITKERSFSNEKHSWSNTSQFLKQEGYLGGKSGYTDEARQTVVSLFSVPLGDQVAQKNKNIESRSIAIALLGSLDRSRDVENILKYLKKNIYYGSALDVESGLVQEKEKIPKIKEPDFVTLSFAGDIMLDRGVKNSVMKNFGGDYSKLFEKSKELSEALKKPDIMFANLEGPAGDQGIDQKNLYSFRMDAAVVPALRGTGIDILSVANNHIGDFGREAFIDTLARLKENEILYTGGGMDSRGAEEPIIIEKYGIKIGYLGFSDLGPNSLQAGANVAGILSASNPRFDEIIKNAAQKVDHLVVYFHFGEEYKDKHNVRQEYLAKRAVDDGAKIVIGSNSHVIQDSEIYKDSYIAYSLGNFIFDQAFSAQTMQGLLLNVKLKKDGNMEVRKDIVKLNRAFQPETVIKGKEEKIKLSTPPSPVILPASEAVSR